MTETKPKLKLSLKPRTLGLNLAVEVLEEKNTKLKAAKAKSKENKPTPPKVAKAPKVQVKKKLREHKIIDPEIYKKILKHLQTKYPNCFTRPVKPLAIGIYKELLGECEELGISGVQLKSFFKAYCKNSKYRELIVVGAERVGLKGKVTSLVTEEEAHKTAAKTAKKEE